MNDATVPVTRGRMERLQKILMEVMDTVRGPLTEVYDQRVEEDPTQVKATTRAKREFISSMQRRVDSPG